MSNINVIKIHNPINIYFNFITTFLDNTIIMPIIINNGTIKDISVSGFDPSQGHPSPTQCPFPLPPQK